MEAITNRNMQMTMKIAVLVIVALIAAVAAMVSLAALPATAGAAATTTFSIPVEQVFDTTPGIEREGAFNYELRRVGATYPMPDGAQGDTFAFTLTGNEARDIGPLTFIHAGFFTYEIRSTSAQEQGFVLDDRVYTVIIAVSNTAGGGLSAEIRAVYTRAPGTTADAKAPFDGGRVVFEKGYGALASDPAQKDDPAVVKTVQGNPAVAYTFTFRLTAETEGAPMPTGADGNTFDITITGSGRAYFGTWSYTSGGVFTYTVREIASDNSDYRFDDTVYTITDTVSSVDGQLVVDRVVTNADNRQVTSMSFINFYVGDDTEVQEEDPPPGGGTTTPRPGPKTGDYADPASMVLAMIISAVIAAFTLFLIYMDRRSEKEHGNLVVAQSQYYL